MDVGLEIFNDDCLWSIRCYRVGYADLTHRRQLNESHFILLQHRPWQFGCERRGNDGETARLNGEKLWMSGETLDVVEFNKERKSQSCPVLFCLRCCNGNIKAMPSAPSHYCLSWAAAFGDAVKAKEKSSTATTR